MSYKKMCNFGAVKYARLFIGLMLLLFTGKALASESIDSLVFLRLYNYQRNFTNGGSGFSSNFYCKYMYQIHRRNVTLWLIPHMYTVAEGERVYLSERYGRMHFYDLDDNEYENQVYYTTIPRNRSTMPILSEYMTPSIYSVSFYGDHILSPFHRDNANYYHYKITPIDDEKVRMYFRPRFVRNTQLLRGVATIEIETGRVMEVSFDGEYDLIKFRTIAMMGNDGARSLMPSYCHTDISFKFMGNHITSSFEAVFDCPIRLPDTLDVEGDRALIEQVRPVSLSAEEQAIYDRYDEKHAPDSSEEEAEETGPVLIADEDYDQEEMEEASEEEKESFFKKLSWSYIGKHLVVSHRKRTEKSYMKLSPILEPQYISYSGSKGLSYKMKYSYEYYPNAWSGLYFYPQVGYNFKFNEFRFNVPLRWVYNNRKYNYLELVWRNGNRISNAIAEDEIKKQLGEDIPLPDDLSLFSDNELRLYNDCRINNHFTLETGIVYHHRRAIKRHLMKQYGQPTDYHSVAPAIGVKMRPWEKGPMFSIDYEHGLGGKNNSLSYDRWEVDASLKYYITSLQTFNFRTGGGLYTHRADTYFNDFANFRDNNLPEGWNDDWTGNFQLLDSRLYNESKYYYRGNISYESPLLLAAFTPVVGRFVDQERFYWSGLLIENCRPYSEFGYGFSSRYFSIGFFAGFFNVDFYRFGTKFTFELFRRW